MTTYVFRAALAAGAVIAIVASSGCTKTAGATVTGLVTIDGKPAPAGLRIDFEPQVKNGSSSTGYTDKEGRYEMRFNMNRVGVMPGESLVRMLILPELNLKGDVYLSPELKAIRLPDSVGTNSTLRKTVKPGHNEIDIAVETKPTKK